MTSMQPRDENYVSPIKVPPRRNAMVMTRSHATVKMISKQTHPIHARPSHTTIWVESGVLTPVQAVGVLPISKTVECRETSRALYIWLGAVLRKVLEISPPFSPTTQGRGMQSAKHSNLCDRVLRCRRRHQPRNEWPILQQNQPLSHTTSSASRSL